MAQWQEPKEHEDSASDLIERAEREAGCRWDDPDNPGALNILFGALNREMGRSPGLRARDDFAAGAMIRYEMSPEGKRRRAAEDTLAQVLRAGLDPEVLYQLGRGKSDA